MRKTAPSRALILAVLATATTGWTRAETPISSTEGQEAAVARLVASMFQETPLVRDLEILTREIGGRATGSEANLRSVAWAHERFEGAGVSARRETFEMPQLWLERSAAVEIRGEEIDFVAAAAAMPYSTATPVPGVSARLVDGGSGSTEDFERLGREARGAFLLVETSPLLDIEGLFREYDQGFDIERRAVDAAAAGVVYMSSRAEGILYRHNSTLRGEEARPMLVLERGAARRALDLLRSGNRLELTAVLDLETGPAYESQNVIGEIRGFERPDEIVLVGAHLDSWDLGDGALDNGANVALLIDVARQMHRLGVRPRRTVRFALWNGEEQGLYGSYGYTLTHAEELDHHVVAMSFDIGCGRINGFFTGGRPEILATLERSLDPVRGLGPFTSIDVPVVGTDNYDFMMQGVANLVGNQESATYGPNYHAQSDRIGQCDLRTLRLNAAIVAAVTYGFATAEIPWRRQTAAEIEQLVQTTDLERQMRVFNSWDAWQDGTRGRRR